MIKLVLIINLFRRNYCKVINSISLKISEHGDPIKVVHQIESSLNTKLKSNEVLIKYLASVIHPSDINVIQGQYPIKPQLSGICGSEGYAQVVDAGASLILKQGDFVIPRTPVSGTWTTYKIVADIELIKLRTPLSPEIGAVFSVNPCTAYRMLKDFKTLTTGGVFIQNGGTSAVSLYATQLGKLWGLTSISIIRSRPTQEQTAIVKDLLKNEYGATFVLTEEEIQTQLPKIIKQTGPAQLGLNCVGGKAILPLLRVLGKSGIIVTYGAMSQLPIQLPVSQLIFSDVQIRGFWMSAWTNERWETKIRHDMIEEMNDLFHRLVLKPSPFSTFDFVTHWKEALSKSMFGHAVPGELNKKNILVMH